MDGDLRSWDESRIVVFVFVVVFVSDVSFTESPSAVKLGSFQTDDSNMMNDDDIDTTI